MDFIS
jgi:hypothetical protein